MAEKEDLSEQLALTQKLAAQIERMASAASRLEQSYQGQIDAVEKLANAFNQINAQGAVQNIEALNKTISDATSKMKQAGSTSESSFQKLGKKVEETGKKIGDRFPKSVAIGVAALSGLRQGVSNLVSMTKGITGFVAGFVDGMTSIAASIIAIPFKLFDGLFNMAMKSAGGTNELAKAIEELRKQFGELYGPTNKTIIDTSKNLNGFADTGLNAWQVFGNLADRLTMLRELATEMGAQFNKFLGEFRENGGALLAYQKGLGLSAEQMKSIGIVATATGQKMSKVLKDFTKFSKALADSDADAKLLSRDMGKMAGDVKHFGSLGAKELGEVALYARKLGIEVDKMTGTLDAFESFDSAAENAAKLSQAFGANVDAFKLMESQNPAEQFDMLRKSMFAAGKSAENMTRQELKLLAQTTGMDEQTAKLAFSMQNQGMGLDEIKKKSGDAEKRTLTQAQAMAKLADAIERMVQSGGGQGGFTSFWDAFLKGFLGGIQSSKEFREIMINIQHAVRVVYMEGLRLGKAFVEMFPGVKQFLQGIADFFQPAKFKSLVGGVVDILIQWMKDLQDPHGKASFASLMDKLKEKFFDFFDKESPAGRKMLDGFKSIFKTIIIIISESIKWASDKVGEGIEWIIGLITGKNKIGSGVSNAAKGGLGFLAEAFAPLGDALKHAWVAIAPKLWELIKILGKKLFEYLTSEEFLGIIKPAIPIVAGVLFGPAFTRALVAAGASALIKGTGSIVGSLGKKLLSTVAEKAAEISSASKAPKIGDKVPAPSDASNAVQSGKAMEKGGGISWSSVLKFLVAFAGVVLIGMAAVFAAIAVIRKFEITPKELMMGLAVIAAASLAMLPIGLTLVLLSKVPIDPKGAAMGILAIGLSILAMVGVLALIYAALKEVNLTKLKLISEILVDMSKVFLMAGAIVVIAMGIGSAILASVGIGAAVLGMGLAAMSSAIAVMATAAIKIMKELDSVPMGPGFKDKIDAFTKIMDAITNFAKNLTAILDAVKPSFITLITGKDDTVDRINAVKGMLEAMIGQPGGGGIIGIMETIMRALNQLANGNDRMLEGGKMLAELLSAVSGLASAMKPPDKMFEAIEGMWTTSSDVLAAMDKVKEYAAQITNGVKEIITVFVEKVMPLISGNESMNERQIKAAAAVGNLLGAVVQIAENMTPKESVINAMRTTIGGTFGRDDNFLNSQNMVQLGNIIKTISEGLQKMIPTVLEALGPVLEQIGKWHFTEHDANALKSIGPLLQQMFITVQSVTAQSSQLAQMANGNKIDTATTFLDKLADVIPSFMESVAKSLPSLFEALKSGIIKMAQGFDPKQLESGIKAFSGVMAVVGDVPKMFSAMGAEQGDNNSLMGKGQNMANVIRQVANFFEFMMWGDESSRAAHLDPPLTRLVGALKDPLIQQLGGLKENVEGLKMTFGVVGDIIKIVSDVKTMAVGGDISDTGYQMSRVINQIADFFAFIILGGRVDGEAYHPALPRLVVLIGDPVIKELAALKPVLEPLKGMFGMIVDLLKVVQDLNVNVTQGSDLVDSGFRMANIIKQIANFFSFLILGGSVSGAGFSPPIPQLNSVLKSDALKSFAGFKGTIAALPSVFSGLNDLAAAVGGIGAVKFDDEDMASRVGKLANFMKAVFDNKSGGLSILSQISGSMSAVAKGLKVDGVIPALEAIGKMVELINDLNQQLDDPAKVDLPGKLKTYATAVGLGGRAQYTVNPTRNVTITINMAVELNAADMEKALVMRGSSIIRNRINWALSDASTNAAPLIPSSPVESLPDVSAA